MKLNIILSSAVFAAIVAMSQSAIAAEPEKSTEAKEPAANVQEGMSPEKKAKRHSHMEEKTGIPASQTTSSEKPSPAKDTSKHLHPRDGK